MSSTNRGRTYCRNCGGRLILRRGWKECVHCRNIVRRKRDADKRLRIYRLKIEAKSQPCTDCGLSFPYYVMDFDHIYGERRFWLGRSTQGWTLEQVIEEIAKCDVVCANCHRIRTFNRSGRQEIV